MIPSDVFDLLADDEGCVDHVYFLNGIPHVGFGHNLVNGPKISTAALKMILKDDVAFFADKCQHLAGWAQMSDARQAVVLNIAFNVGFGGLLDFVKFLHAISVQAWDDAAAELLDSDAARQLPDRYKRLAAIMRTDNIGVAKDG